MIAPAQGNRALTTTQAHTARTIFALLAKGESAAALDLARRLAADAPESADSQHVLALSLASSADIDAAERAFARALALAPDHPAILRNLATFRRRSGRYADAAEAFRQLAKTKPNDPQPWIDCGLAELDAGDPAASLASLERARALAPTSALLWQAIGCAARAAGDDAAAEAAFRRCTELEPMQPEHWFNLAIAERRRGRAQRALDCFEHAARLGMSGPTLADAEIGALLDSGAVEAALARARAAVASWPESADLQRTLAQLLWEYTDEPALAALEAAVDAGRGQTPLATLLCQMLLETGCAAEALERSRALGHENPVGIALMRAEALSMLGDRRAARRTLEDLFSAGHRELAQLRWHARICLADRDPERALTILDTLLARTPYDQEALAYRTTAWRMLDDEREFWSVDYARHCTLLPVFDVSESGDADWMAGLAAVVSALHAARREPIRQSLRHGSQTPGRLFGRDDPFLERLAARLLDVTGRWIASLPRDQTHPFLARANPSVRYAGSWSVRLKRSGFHVNHIHNEGWLSSAFYVQLPPAIAQALEAGCLTLGQPPTELGLALAPRRVVRPVVGHLALFPSYCWHGTVPFDDPHPRMTIAFDLVPDLPAAAWLRAPDRAGSPR